MLAVFLLIDFLVYRLGRTNDVYVTVPGHPRVRLIPRQILTVRDVPILRHFVDEEQNDECGNVVLSRKPQLLFDRWQVYKKKDLPMISAWGAFLDTRTEPEKGLVRIFAVSEQYTGQAVFCQFWTNKSNANEPHLVITEANYKVIGRGYRKGPIKYSEYLYNCPLPENDLRPHSVSLALERCRNSTINLPILVLEEKQNFYEHQYGVCVLVAYNRIDPKRIIEWVELNKILGITEINIYNSNLVSDTLAILEHYQKEGIIKIHNAPPPIQSWDYWPRKLSVIAGLNDCMYRNMYKYNMTVVIDFDEVIIPHGHLHYDTMFREIYSFHKTADISAFQFRNAYFFLDLPPDDNYPTALVTQQFRRRVKISGPGYSVKSITNPRKCVVMMNHYCLVKLPGVKNFVLNVNPKFGLNQHYKRCHLGKECKKMLNETTQEDTMLRFRSNLLERVKNQYFKLNITFT